MEDISRSEFKRMEYIGDSLYGFISKHLLMKQGCTAELKAKVMHIQRNCVMGKVAIKIGIKPHPDVKLEDGTYRNYIGSCADALEVRIYQEFLQGGYEQAEKFFIENILPHLKL